MRNVWTDGRSRRQKWRVCLILAFLPALFAPATTFAAILQSVAAEGDQIVLEFDEAVTGARMMLLDAPRRLAVDVTGATSRDLRHAATGALVQATRTAQRDADTTRVVFDLAQPAVVVGSGFAEDGKSLRLTLAAADATGFAKAVRGRARTLFTQMGFRSPSPALDGASIVVPLEPAAPFVRPETPAIRGGRGRNRPLVVIDAGHGGHDPGATSVLGGRKEKDAALAIAKAIRDELVGSGRVRVALTREDDRFIVLGERREMARRMKADLFISVHADSAPSSDTARGASIYTLSEVASDRVAAQLAARENRADILNGVNLGGETADVSSILLDLTRRETMNVSSSFASLLQREMSPAVSFKTGYHRFAGLIVLKAPDVPSVLLETGYLSNLDDSRFLFSDEGRQAIASGVKGAVIAYFARRMASR